MAIEIFGKLLNEVVRGLMRDVDPCVPSRPLYKFGQELIGYALGLGLSIHIISGGLVPLLHRVAIGAQQVHEADRRELTDKLHEILSHQVPLEIVFVLSQHHPDVSDWVALIRLDQVYVDSVVQHG